MEIAYKPKALADRDLFKKSGNKPLQKKIQDLIVEIEKHPRTGTGKPEPLKYELSSYWSRRINREHRIIYKIDDEDNKVEIYSLSDHY